MRTRIAAAWCLLLLLTLGLAACGGVPRESGSGAGLGQAALEASIRNDRKHLFDGSLTYTPDISMSVGGRLTYAVVLTARGEKSSRRAAQAALETRVLRVGGWQGAGLSADDPEVKTVLHGPEKQPIVAPGENAQWQWSVSADEPGDYDLALTVITYQGNTNRALETLDPPISVHLKVYNTWSHRFSAMRNWLYTAAGIAGALVGIYALRAPLTELVQGRREARKQQRDENRDGYM
ncbi:hypothetical protein AB0N07_22970 [Streptomyces sp. NPDC051172]|uniref:hypothetical protein n=1 Tax=Streptomyces sp. NPDC051172 TaxID=3155796 RepID=UPI0034278008